MKPANIAWGVIATGVLAYEFLCPEGELLSEGFDGYVSRFPVTARVLPLILTLHVINALPSRFDPVHRGSVLLAALWKDLH